jgi:hypothetical protein
VGIQRRTPIHCVFRKDLHDLLDLADLDLLYVELCTLCHLQLVRELLDPLAQLAWVVSLGLLDRAGHESAQAGQVDVGERRRRPGFDSHSRRGA